VSPWSTPKRYKADGRSVNVAWPTSGFGDGDYIYAFQKIIMPIAYEFAPDLVISQYLLHPLSGADGIVSAGFDAAEGDQLGQCHVSPAAYGHMTHMLCALASGKVVVALEVSLPSESKLME
jgi:histone deacetylase 6